MQSGAGRYEQNKKHPSIQMGIFRLNGDISIIILFFKHIDNVTTLAIVCAK